jgi:hypothetical protein
MEARMSLPMIVSRSVLALLRRKSIAIVAAASSVGNPGAERIFSYTNGEAIGQYLDIIFQSGCGTSGGVPSRDGEGEIR